RPGGRARGAWSGALARRRDERAPPDVARRGPARRRAARDRVRAGARVDVPPERGPAGRARRRRPRCGVGRHPGARPDGFTPGGGRGERESVRGSAANNSALVGAIWVVAAPAPLHELSFDVGVRHGISRAANEWGGTAGLTFAFPVWSAGT